MSPPVQAAVFLVEVLGGLAVLLLLLRVLLQALDADYYNPISQGIVRFTAPVLRPLRRVLPSSTRVNGPALAVLFVVQLLEVYLTTALRGYVPSLPGAMLMTLAQLLSLLTLLYLGLLIAQAVASWIPAARGPALYLVAQLTEPLLAPLRRLLPPMGGLDFSVLAALVSIELVRILVLRPLLESAALMMVRGW